MTRLLTFILILTLNLTTIAYAADPLEPFGGSGDPVSTGGVCDFGQFLQALGERESNNNYQAKNSLGFLGRWQFGSGALQDIGWKRDGVWTGSALNFGVHSNEDFLNTPAAQDQAMKEWMDLLAQRAESFGVTDYLDQNVGGCTVTWSSIIAGRHLCGYGNREDKSGQCHKGTSLIQFLESGGRVDGVDGYGTPVSEYVCKFSGLNMPYEHGGKATDCSTVNNMGETGNSETPITYPGTPGGGHTGPSVDDPSPGQFEYLSQALKYTWVAAFKRMTSQITTSMMQQVQIIGTFFDASHQLSLQSLLQEKTAEAHKDYHPSVQMCEIGTLSRNLRNTERRASLTKTALTRAMLDRALATGDSKTGKNGSDKATKRRALVDTFCNTADNAKENEVLCQGGYAPDQVNADINFTYSIDAPLTLDINLLDDETTKEEENIFSFLDYIFMYERFPWMSQEKTILFSFMDPYQDMRSTIALRSVAQNSFTEIIAQKIAGPDGANESVGPFIKSLMREMGMSDEDIEETISDNPGYYEQMEALTQDIYYRPEFIINLYDKPANVKRITAAMTAIKLMQDRDIRESLERREMLMSVLLELQLREKQNDLHNRVIRPVVTQNPGEPDATIHTGAPAADEEEESGF